MRERQSEERARARDKVEIASAQESLISGSGDIGNSISHSQMERAKLLRKIYKLIGVLATGQYGQLTARRHALDLGMALVKPALKPSLKALVGDLVIGLRS